MITDDQYKAAKELVNRYEQWQSWKAVQNLKCICCKKAVTPVEGLPLPSPSRLETGAWEEGAVVLVIFGYGSKMHDGTTYYIALCDTCMQATLEQGFAINASSVYFSL